VAKNAVYFDVEPSMKNAIYGHARTAAGFWAVRSSKQLVGRVAAWRLDGVRVWAQGKIERFSTRRWHPATFPVAMAVGMGLLWAQMHGYLHIPVSVCDWVQVGK
jgi:hypothetical protein